MQETLENGMIPFLDVYIQRTNDNKLQLKVHRKSTCSNIYIHWNSFAPTNWKIGTLEGMIRRVHMICTEKDDLDSELAFISDTFSTINGYLLQVIKRSQEKMKQKLARTDEATNHAEEATEEEEKNQLYMEAPYAGKQGEKIMSMIVKKMPESVRPRIVYNGTKLSTFFSVKDKVRKEHSIATWCIPLSKQV